MEKYQWKESLGRKILEMYESVRPLEDREKEFLALCLAYPEKFWKTANLYSNSNKARIPEKSVEKLQTAARAGSGGYEGGRRRTVPHGEVHHAHERAHQGSSG